MALTCVDRPLSTGPAGVSVSAVHESDKPFPGGLLGRMGKCLQKFLFCGKTEGRRVNIMYNWKNNKQTNQPKTRTRLFGLTLQGKDLLLGSGRIESGKLWDFPSQSVFNLELAGPHYMLSRHFLFLPWSSFHHNDE